MGRQSHQVQLRPRMGICVIGAPKLQQHRHRAACVTDSLTTCVSAIAFGKYKCTMKPSVT